MGTHQVNRVLSCLDSLLSQIPSFKQPAATDSCSHLDVSGRRDKGGGILSLLICFLLTLRSEPAAVYVDVTVQNFTCLKSKLSARYKLPPVGEGKPLLRQQCCTSDCDAFITSACDHQSRFLFPCQPRNRWGWKNSSGDTVSWKKQTRGIWIYF